MMSVKGVLQLWGMKRAWITSVIFGVHMGTNTTLGTDFGGGGAGDLVIVFDHSLFSSGCG